MLKIEVKGKEVYDEITNTFIYTEDTTLLLEHSLKSLSEWESIHKESFMEKFASNQMNAKDISDYIKCMVIEPKDVSDDIILSMTKENLENIINYINDSKTATTFNDRQTKEYTNRFSKKEIITAEIIYYWMIALEIPLECENWHLNKLLTLIRVCSIKNSPNGKKMSKREILASNKALNAQRRAKLGSKG